MKKYKWIVILANLFILLYILNNSVLQKEKLLSNGQLILLELVPVDPRSLMQGDYFRLRYEISEITIANSISKRGFCVVKLNENGIVSKRVRIQDKRVPLAEHEYLIEYTSKESGDINIGAESFFFQEGKGEEYGNAKYGGIKTDKQGNSLLIGMYDENLNLIE